MTNLNIHPNIALDLRNETELSNYKAAKTELFELALSLNGTVGRTWNRMRKIYVH